jgi:hypothetical protein
MRGGFEGEMRCGGWMCAMFLIPTSSQYIDRVFLYLTQKNHLEGFRLLHRGTLVGSSTPAYTVMQAIT